MAQSQQQRPPAMDADTMLDVYILDYLVKKNYGNSTKAFEGEAKVPANVRGKTIDAPRGFLFEWWTVFWDTFISRYKRHQGSMEPSNEIIRAPHHQQGGQHQSQSFNANNINIGKSPWIGDTSTLMKQPVPKQWYGDNTALIMNHINSINQIPIEHQKQALDINSLTNSMINPNSQGHEGIPIGSHATGGLNSMPLKGWPLTQQGLDQIQMRIQHQQGQIQNEGQIHPLNDRKRKQPMISVGPNSLVMISSNAKEVSKPNSPQNEKINVDDFIDYGAFDGNENSLLPHANEDPEEDTSNGFTFMEVGSIEATSIINCCHISNDGKLVAIGGQDKKARLWCTSTRENKATLEGHSQAITDIRFSPSMLLLATSSQDKTIRIWDLENLGGAIRTFSGHTVSVLSVDFHPKKEDIVCSCDESEIRFWSIKNAGCVKVMKGGADLVRFQLGVGKIFAAVFGKSVTLMDLENPQARKHVLKGHASNVQSICWDSLGEKMISVSEDLVKVWRIDSGGKANSIHELNVDGKRFRCATFHPHRSSLLIVGCYQSMELWNMTENRLMTPSEEPVCAVAVSTTSGLIASAGHNDNLVKIWK